VQGMREVELEMRVEYLPVNTVEQLVESIALQVNLLHMLQPYVLQQYVLKSAPPHAAPAAVALTLPP